MTKFGTDWSLKVYRQTLHGAWHFWRFISLNFFDIMTHLLYHFVNELDTCGFVSAKWMYHNERYMTTLKHYVRNMAKHFHV